MDFSLNGGVLIIGSLLWDQNSQRVNWRNRFLKVNNQTIVSAPIRYGRISSERENTYTMVFSNDCNSSNFLGKGIFVPFIDNPINLERLLKHSKEIIKSERKKTELENDRNNWRWGALTLLINPELLFNTSEKYQQVKVLADCWSTKFSSGFNPEDYKVGTEMPIVNKSGILNSQWPNELKLYDFVIATATKPQIDAYPTSEDIALKMIENNCKEYFTKNREFGISSFQDEEIAQQLSSNEKKQLI